jgi:hypothetical protein
MEEAKKALWIVASKHKKMKEKAHKEKKELQKVVEEIVDKYLNEKN